MSFSISDFFSLKGSRRSAARAPDKEARSGRRSPSKPRARRSNFLFESIEPRLLLSADTFLTGLTANLTTGLTEVGTEIGEVLDTDPLFNVYVPGVVEQGTAGDETREVSPTFGEAMSISVDVRASVTDPDPAITPAMTLAAPESRACGDSRSRPRTHRGS